MKLRSTVRVAWFAVAALALSACWYVQHQYERRIARAQVSVESLYEKTAANERTVREAARLRGAHDAARRELNRLGAPKALPAATAALLDGLESQARRHRTTIAGVTPVSMPPAPPGRMHGLSATPITVHVRGAFRDLLAFLSDVSRDTALLEIRRTQLAPAGKTGSHGETLLDASIDATFYKLAPHAVSGV